MYLVLMYSITQAPDLHEENFGFLLRQEQNAWVTFALLSCPERHETCDPNPPRKMQASTK